MSGQTLWRICQCLGIIYCAIQYANHGTRAHLVWLIILCWHNIMHVLNEPIRKDR